MSYGAVDRRGASHRRTDRPWRGGSRRRTDGRGLNSVELAIILPILLLVVFGTIHVSIYYHAVNTAHSAAAVCAERARGFDSSAADGQVAAERLLDQVPGLDQSTIGATDDGFEVRCTVTGTAPVMVTLGLGPITATATLPKEQVG